MDTSIPVPLRIDGLEQSLHLFLHGEQDQFVSRRIREEGVWEPYETSLVRDVLRPGDVFVDIGANIGYFSILAASVVGNEGTVFAFEPDPENCRLLQDSARLNGLAQCIHLVQAGLSDTQGDGELFLSEDNLGDHQTYATAASRNSIPITLYNGSTYLRDRLSRIDLIKIDTQGSEYQVVAGLLPLLLELPRKPRIIIELTPYSLRAAAASGRALIELLAQLRQPFWVIDHIEHRLGASFAEELAGWCDDVDSFENNEGFMNIMVGRSI